MTMPNPFALTKTRFSDIEIPKFSVVIYNDNITPYDFVVSLLVMVFGRNHQDAIVITDNIHQTGQAIANTYSREIAEQKLIESQQIILSAGHPLHLELRPN